MIRSVSHPSGSAWHRTHRARARRAWLFFALIVSVALALAVFGYLAPVDWPSLGTALLRTLYRLLAAYGIALIIGVALALLVGASTLIDFFFPVFDVLQNVPSFALIPLFIYFLGFTDTMIIAFSVTSIIWPILFAVLTAIKSAREDLNDAAAIFGATGYRRLAYYLAPLSFPAIVTGSIVGIAIGWETVIGAEIIADTSGFGAFIKSASVNGVNAEVIAGTLAILVLVFVVNRLVWAPLLSESTKRFAE